MRTENIIINPLQYNDGTNLFEEVHKLIDLHSVDMINSLEDKSKGKLMERLRGEINFFIKSDRVYMVTPSDFTSLETVRRNAIIHAYHDLITKVMQEQERIMYNINHIYMEENQVGCYHYIYLTLPCFNIG